MIEPEWLADESVIAIHQLQLDAHGGMAGIRDEGMLSSALHRPLHLWNYARASADVAALAAAYASGISHNHPFLDGNKRTAAVACETFLELNGYELTASDDQWYETMIALASSSIDEATLAQWIRDRLQPRKG
jgi:death-on-curing protein